MLGAAGRPTWQAWIFETAGRRKNDPERFVAGAMESKTPASAVKALRDVADTWRAHVEEKDKTRNCRLFMLDTRHKLEHTEGTTTCANVKRL